MGKKSKSKKEQIPPLQGGAGQSAPSGPPVQAVSPPGPPVQVVPPPGPAELAAPISAPKSAWQKLPPPPEQGAGDAPMGPSEAVGRAQQPTRDASPKQGGKGTGKKGGKAQQVSIEITTSQSTPSEEPSLKKQAIELATNVPELPVQEPGTGKGKGKGKKTKFVPITTVRTSTETQSEELVAGVQEMSVGQQSKHKVKKQAQQPQPVDTKELPQGVIAGRGKQLGSAQTPQVSHGGSPQDQRQSGPVQMGRGSVPHDQRQPRPGRGVPSQAQGQPGPVQVPRAGRGVPSQAQGQPGPVQAPQAGRGVPSQAQGQPGPVQALQAGRGVPSQAQEQPGPSQSPKKGPAASREGPPQSKPPTQATPAGAKAAPPGQEMSMEIVKKKVVGKGGTEGRPIVVKTNHFPLDINPKITTAIHYDVTIDPDKPRRLMGRIMELFRKQNFPRNFIAFDEVKNLYSPGYLPFNNNISGQVELAEEEGSKPKTYKVDIKYAATVDLRPLTSYFKSGGAVLPQDAIQCIDIVLRCAPSLRFVKVGRSFFSPPNGQVLRLGDGLEMWQGHFQSVTLGWKPYLNVDVAHKGFPEEQCVIKYFEEISRGYLQQELRSNIRDAATKFLKGLKVEYQLPRQTATRRTYRVNGLVDIPPKARFTMSNGKQTTIMDYFKVEKNYRIEYPQMPCLWVGSRNSKIYLPPELCKIVGGQARNQKLNPFQTSKMIKGAATDTNRRQEKIMNSMKTIDFNSNDTVRAFGLSVAKDFEEVKARVLKPPLLTYKNQNVMPSKGIWRNGLFHKAVIINKWTILNMDKRVRPDSLNYFASTIQSEARRLGLQMDAPAQPYKTIDLYGNDTRPLETFFQQHKDMSLIFVIIHDMYDIYSSVKRTAELKEGCLTQCIRSRTLERFNQTTAINILLKVNAKLNGMNHLLAAEARPRCLRSPCMIMGADVTHPSPDQLEIPSVAAVTASHDPNAFQYNFCWRLQPARQEIITDLKEIMQEQLKYFRKMTNYAPAHIVFYRDGVSEGQFQQVLNSEFRAIREACTSLNPSYQPKITFLVVQKRHHTRLFPKDPRDSEDRNMNVPAGTCVDTNIVHPTHLEYYLVSHASIQGVAKPTKYRVLWDDLDMTEDEIEKLTYYLCHLFTRCNRSVSYPAPTYYAHLAAFRARHYITGQNIDMSNLQREQERNTIKENISKDCPMFFV